MVSAEALQQAIDRIFEAALQGQGWDLALTKLAEAGEAAGVMIMRNKNRSYLSSFHNALLADPATRYRDGHSPPNSRQTRVQHNTHPGFRIDADDYTDDDLKRDPYYQEFLRPLGLFWHANARLYLADDEEIAISFKRQLSRGPYSREDAAILDQFLPKLRTAAHIANRLAQASTASIVALSRERGDVVFEIDPLGNVIREHAAENFSVPARVRARRLRMLNVSQQPLLDRAIERAIGLPGHATTAAFADEDGWINYCHLIPVKDHAKDVFQSTAALAVWIKGKSNPRLLTKRQSLLREAFGLTEREAEVASLVCEGLDLKEIAAQLNMKLTTARTHLDGVFGKTGTRRQAAFVALISRIIG